MRGGATVLLDLFAVRSPVFMAQRHLQLSHRRAFHPKLVYSQKLVQPMRIAVAYERIAANLRIAQGRRVDADVP